VRLPLTQNCPKYCYGLDRFFSSLYGKVVPELCFLSLSLLRVAYLRPAENDYGPLVSRLIDINWPVIHTRNGFSSPLRTQLASI
jgi:hypothetical protein